MKPFNAVPQVIIEAREILGRAMRAGDSRGIELAYKALESADRMSRAKRRAMHSTRIAVAILDKL